jgi:predicted nucleic acid-binding protein/ribosomal protein L30E
MNVKQTLECLTQLPISQSILICGNHGLGKSQVVKQAAKILDVPCIDFRLSQNDVGDLKGMPFHVHGRTVFATPEWFPLKETDMVQLKEFLGLTADIAKSRYGDKGILFLDEPNRAVREVQQAAFELILDRRLNLRELPDGWRVVSAVNDEDDIYTVNSMDPAFLSRFFVIKFNPSVEEWLEWAILNNVHPVIVEFIRRYPELLDPTKELLQEASTKGITLVHNRRAWEMFSRTINKMEADHKAGLRSQNPLSKGVQAVNWMFQLAGGYISTVAQSAFKKFLETDYQALDANIILNKWDKDVEARLKDIVAKNRITEIAAYNELLIAWLLENSPRDITEERGLNLARYLDLLPNEPALDFWKKWNKVDKVASEKWYKMKSLRNEFNHKIILSVSVNPILYKKNQAAAAAK